MALEYYATASDLGEFSGTAIRQGNSLAAITADNPDAVKSRTSHLSAADLGNRGIEDIYNYDGDSPSTTNDFNIYNSKVKTNTETALPNLISKSMTSIEGIPYQFSETVDRRLQGTTVGRKY